MTTPYRGRCPVCHRSILLRGVDGLLRVHPRRHGEPTNCPGSKQPPERMKTALQKRIHPRRTQ